MTTLSKINQASIIESIREPARRVIELRRKAAALREEVDKIKRLVMAEMQLKDEEGNLITDPQNDWESNDADFAEYDKRLQSEIRTALPWANELPVGVCPALFAEDLLRKAEYQLIESGAPFLGITADMVIRAGNDKRKQFLDLLLKLA
jgi:hypothetical protein